MCNDDHSSHHHAENCIQTQTGRLLDIRFLCYSTPIRNKAIFFGAVRPELGKSNTVRVCGPQIGKRPRP